jgi:hypothetical protein
MREQIDKRQLEIETTQLESEAKELRELVSNLKREATALGRSIEQQAPDPEDSEEYMAATREIRELKQERVSTRGQLEEMRTVIEKIQGERENNVRELEQARTSSTTATRRAKMFAAIQGEGRAGTTPQKSDIRRWFEVKGEHLTGLRMYSRPTIDSEEVDCVYGGTSVEVMQEHNDGMWLQILHRNQRGWVTRRVVTLEPEDRGPVFTVTGAGLSEVNGQYHAAGYCDGVHRYQKRGSNYHLIRYNHAWYLSFLGPESANWGQSGEVDFYCTQANQGQANPPGLGWNQSSKSK